MAVLIARVTIDINKKRELRKLYRLSFYFVGSHPDWL